MKREWPEWVEEKVLRFLNTAETASDFANLTASSLLPGSDGSPDLLIGKKVAARILDTRDHLGDGIFTHLHQLRDIRGVGADKFASIMEVFNRPSSQKLIDALNQTGLSVDSARLLVPQTGYVQSVVAYEELTGNAYIFREHIASRLATLARQMGHTPLAEKMLEQSMQHAFIEPYDNNDSGAALALALWLYQFKADECFPFPKALDACRAYIGHSTRSGSSPMQLWLIKPLDQTLLYPGGAPAALPVVGHEAERSLTLWLAHLDPEFVGPL